MRSIPPVCRKIGRQAVDTAALKQFTYFAASSALGAETVGFGASTPRRHRITIPPIAKMHPAKIKAISVADIVFSCG